MTQEWAIAVFGAICTLMLALMSAGVKALFGINRKLGEVVTRAECTVTMDRHCDQLETQRQKIQKLEVRVVRIEEALKK